MKPYGLMNEISLDKITDTINESLKDTCQDLKIVRYLPGAGSVEQPQYIINGCMGDKTFSLKYFLADLLLWQEQDILSEILFRDRHLAINNRE
jgi:hypothetical protein